MNIGNLTCWYALKEAYEEFKHVLVVLIYGKDDHPLSSVSA